MWPIFIVCDHVLSLKFEYTGYVVYWEYLEDKLSDLLPRHILPKVPAGPEAGAAAAASNPTGCSGINNILHWSNLLQDIWKNWFFLHLLLLHPYEYLIMVILFPPAFAECKTAACVKDCSSRSQGACVVYRRRCKFLHQYHHHMVELVTGLDLTPLTGV